VVFEAKASSHAAGSSVGLVLQGVIRPILRLKLPLLTQLATQPISGSNRFVERPDRTKNVANDILQQ